MLTQLLSNLFHRLRNVLRHHLIASFLVQLVLSPRLLALSPSLVLPASDIISLSLTTD